jgi:hypothetical protein
VGGQVRLKAVSSVIAFIALAPIACIPTASLGPDNIAVVDGQGISRRSFADYAAVFTAPDGSLRASSDDILVSLINQALVKKEAIRRSIEVTDAQVEEAIGDMADAQALQAPKAGGDDHAFRERVRMLLLFRAVKAAVIGRFSPSDEALRAAYDADPALQVVSYAEAVPLLTQRIEKQETERLWAAWLAELRRCADIRVLDLTFGTPSSTPAPSC